MNYFAYASNLSKKQMLERCAGSKPRFSATLPNYKLIFTEWSRQWRGGTASIVRYTGEKVPGAVYEVPEHCWSILDKYEGYPASANRLKVIVFNEDGNAVEAVTYIRTGKLEDAPPSKEYIATIQQGYRDWGIF